MQALWAALAGFEFAGWSVHPLATSFQHFVAKYRSEQPRDGVQYFPVQACFLRHLFSRFFHCACGTAGHVFKRELFRCHQGIATAQLGRLLVRLVQTLAGHLGAGCCQAAHTLLAAIGAAGTSRRLRTMFAQELAGVYSKPVLWSRSYCVLSCGGAPLEIIKQYIQLQDRPDD